VLHVGEIAPAIDASTSAGSRFVLAAQRGLATVVYFFPKAFTPGCTAETKLFRKNYNELILAGAAVVGVSTDDLETQCRFAKSLEAPFPIIADADRSISRAYDVLWPVIGMAQRVTYVISPERIIEAVFRHELDIKAHRDDVLMFVNEKFRRTRGTSS
jgi:thioredoxin-dependent peroxiredoxin